MAISFVGSCVSVGNANSPETVNFSSLRDASGSTPTVLQDDYVFVTINKYSSGASAPTTPTGYTDAHSSVFGNDSDDCNVLTSYKKMGSTPDTSVQIPSSGSATSPQIATIFVFRGVDTTTPLDVTPTTAGSTNPNGLLANPPSITPSASGAWIYVTGGGALNATISNYSAPSGLSTTTNHWRSTTATATNTVVIGTGIKTDWTSGAFDCPAYSNGTSNNRASWAAASIVLRPSGTNVTVNGAVGSLAITGYAGSVSINPTVNGTVGSLALTGYAGSATSTASVSGAVGSLTLTGYAGTAALSTTVSGAVGSLSLTGYQGSCLAIEGDSTVDVYENYPLGEFYRTKVPADWSIVGGADAAMFMLAGDTTASTLVALAWEDDPIAPDYEAPSDSGTNNVYDVVIRATAGSTSVDMAIAVTIVDATYLAITSSNTVSVAEGATLSKTLTANMAAEWSIVSSPDEAEFEISGSTLRWVGNGTKDYEAPDDTGSNNVYEVTVFATPTGGPPYEGEDYQTIYVTVTNNTADDPIIVTGSVGSLTITGYAGSISISPSVTGSAGSLTITGYVGFVEDFEGDELLTEDGAILRTEAGAELLYQDENVNGNVGSLTLTGYQGSVSSTATVSGAVGSLVLTGYQGSVASTVTANGAVGSLALTGYAGTTASTVAVSGNVGSLTVTGYQGSTTSGVSVSGNVGSLALTGYQGSQSIVHAVNGNLGSLTITGYAGSVASTAVVSGAVGGLTLTGYQGTTAETDNVTVNGSVGALALTGYSGSATAGATVNGSVGALSFTGYAGTVDAGGSYIVNGEVGNLTFTGYAGEVVAEQVDGDELFTEDGNLLLTEAGAEILFEQATIEVNGGVGSLNVTGYAGSVTSTVAIHGAFGMLNVTGFTGSTSSTATVSGNIGSIAVTGYAGSTNVSYSRTGETGSISIAGNTGSTHANVDVAGQAGSVTFAGYQGSVEATVSVEITGQAGTLTITGIRGFVANGSIPDERVLTIAAAQRRVVVAGQDRTVSVANENREVAVEGQVRNVTVNGETRVVVTPAEDRQVA